MNRIGRDISDDFCVGWLLGQSELRHEACFPLERREEPPFVVSPEDMP